MRYTQEAAAKTPCQHKKQADVLPFGLLQLNSADREETGQTASHQQVEIAGTPLVAIALAFGEELVDWLSEQQHSTVAQLMLVKILVALRLLLIKLYNRGQCNCRREQGGP